jgi:hypothetical protein
MLLMPSVEYLGVVNGSATGKKTESENTFYKSLKGPFGQIKLA